MVPDGSLASLLSVSFEVFRHVWIENHQVAEVVPKIPTVACDEAFRMEYRVGRNEEVRHDPPPFAATFQMTTEVFPGFDGALL